MIKKVLLVTSGLIPYPGLQGSTLVTWSVLMAFRKAGYDIAVCILRRGTDFDQDDLLSKLVAEGINYHILTPDPELVFPTNSLGAKVAASYSEVYFSEKLKTLAEKLKIDLLLLYTVRSLAAAVLPGSWPYRLCFTVDLDHLARMARLNFNLRYGVGKRRFLKYVPAWLSYQRLRSDHLMLLKSCDKVINHAHNHAIWLKEKGVKSVTYLPLPVRDSGKDFAIKKQKASLGKQINKLKIIMVGSPVGIATLSGFAGLINKILPAADEIIGTGKYEVHIIGKFIGLPGTMEAVLRKHSSVIIRGYVDDLADEFFTADVVLVPTPLRLGFRTRIAEAFSYGCCVVAHTANQAGMPEVENDRNILLGDNASDIARACLRVKNEPEIQYRIGEEARKTFETYYDANVVCDKMIQEIR